MKSTIFVSMAAEGMPKNSDEGSSFAITVPTIFLIARIPMAPALPVPVSTTAMALSKTRGDRLKEQVGGGSDEMHQFRV
jgi:hypothetical protein